MKTHPLSTLASKVSGEIIGDPNTSIGIALPLRDAIPRSITLVDSPKNAKLFFESEAAAAVVSEPLQDCDKPQLVVDSIHDAFPKLIGLFRERPVKSQQGIHPGAFIADDVSIGSDSSVAHGSSIAQGCSIGQRCVIHAGVHIHENCTIGDDCVIYPGCMLYEETIVGDRCILHAGVVLGADGFGYYQRDGAHHKSSQLGWVCIEDDVEIGANSTIDRGTYGTTRIGQGTKIDNLVQIGHNCQIGKHNMICALVGIAGSCTTGDYVVMAGQAGLADHVHVNDRAILGGQCGVMNDVPADAVVFGSPAGPRREKLREAIHVSKLPELRKTLVGLQKQVEQLGAELLSGKTQRDQQVTDSGKREAA